MCNGKLFDEVIAEGIREEPRKKMLHETISFNQFVFVTTKVISANPKPKEKALKSCKSTSLDLIMKQ